MPRSDFDLAAMLLQYLRKWENGQSQYKFNVIGKGDAKGNLELNLQIILSREERHTLLWIWGQFEGHRLLNTAHDDGWATLAERAKTISDDELKRIVAPAAISSAAERQIDALLGIPDRREYDKALLLLAAESSAECPLSLLVIDIDHFKRFNDTYGHKTGDAVLKNTAAAISQSIAKKGEAFRYGGEEIVVLLPNHCVAEAESVAERIRMSIEAIVIPNIEAGVTASLGVATLPGVATNLDELFQQADDAMYRSKQNGRNRVTSVKPGEIRLPARVPKTNAKPSIRLRLERASRECYVLEVENFSVAEVKVDQIALVQDEIALMAPVRPEPSRSWVIPGGATTKIEWMPVPNPAASLTQMHPNEGIQFRSNMEFVVSLTYDGTQSDHRQKMAVKVYVPTSEIKQLGA
jgi:diguanylate cyclase (GGDEF)-like protein